MSGRPKQTRSLELGQVIHKMVGRLPEDWPAPVELSGLKVKRKHLR